LLIRNQNQKWFNKDATDVHQPITVIENEMTLLYSKKNKTKQKSISSHINPSMIKVPLKNI